jgi:peptide/nickel transport system permease protein
MSIDEPTSEFHTEDRSFRAARERLGDIQPGDLALEVATHDLAEDEQHALVELELAPGVEPVPRTQWQLFRRRFLHHRMAIVSLLVLVLLFVLCYGAPWIAPYPKNDQNLLAIGQSPSTQHIMGTDDLGRDEFTEILYAGQISLRIGLTVGVVSTLIGAAAGAVAGYYGKWQDQALMRLTDLFLIVPQLIILAIAIKKFGGTPTVISLVLAAVFWMYTARVVRGLVLSLREKEFVESARASGASGTRIIVRHILPNIIGPVMVAATLAVAAAIIAESTLSFLGFGVQPPVTSWGNMLSTAEGQVGTAQAYLIYFPGMMIFLTVIAVNFLGDGLRDAFDPTSKV